MQTADVIVIGGGVMGSSIALHLLDAEPRLRVAVIERDPSYARASSALAMGGIRQQFSSSVSIALVQHSVRFWSGFDDSIRARGQESRANFRQRGYLFIVGHDQIAAFEQRFKLQSSLGARVERLEVGEIARRLPDANLDGIAFGVFGAADGYASPREVLKSMRAGAASAGAEYITAEVSAIDRTDDRVTGVALADGRRISGASVVNAAGPWAARIGAMAGVDLPIAPQRQQLFRCALPERWPYRFPMVVDPTGVHWRHDDPDHVSDLDRIVVARTRADEPTGENFDCDLARWRDDFLPPLVHRMPRFRDLKLIEGWAGLYEMTPDHNPLLGRCSGIEGFFVAAGFSGHGLMMSPAIGQVLAEMILGRAPSIDVTPLAVDRFARGAPLHDGAMI
ncbi:MAG TPA: FAD-binding oxidoreductase [Candidatus Udaeobacter sp.]|jgi:glycine/D-amino acid oxidase-like deaminating enzyme|nr:FAD-binding oxidoreductase [Candidatus Udaeobacter sp.]